MFMGMIAIPVFAPSAGAFGLGGEWGMHFIFPWKGSESFLWDISSGGYIVGFIFAAYFTGWLAERSWDRKPWMILGLLGANALLYVPGLLWLYYLINTDWITAGKPLGEWIAGNGDWDKTLKGGLYPFIAGDLTKLYLASLTLPTAWALVEKLRGRVRKESEE
jgi:biotin transport system substrate-specific component